MPPKEYITSEENDWVFFQLYLINATCSNEGVLTNSDNSEQMLLNVASDQDLHCLTTGKNNFKKCNKYNETRHFYN